MLNIRYFKLPDFTESCSVLLSIQADTENTGKHASQCHEKDTMSLTPKDRIVIIIFKNFHDPNKPKTKESDMGPFTF